MMVDFSTRRCFVATVAHACESKRRALARTAADAAPLVSAVDIGKGALRRGVERKAPPGLDVLAVDRLL